MTMTKRKTKKYLAAQIICSLVLGAYLVGGYSSPVAWGAAAEQNASNVASYSVQWGEAIGKGVLADGNKELITGGTVWAKTSVIDETLKLISDATTELAALTAGFPEGKTIKETIDITAKAITDLETAENGKIAALDLRMDAAESAIDSNINVIIPNIYKTIADLETTENGKIAALDVRVTSAEGAIPVIQQDISDLKNGKLDKTEFNTYKAETAITISTMNTAIKKNADDISDLQTGKLDKAVYEADKADTKAALDGKANVALDNITEDGKTVIKDLAKGAVNVVGDGPVSVAKSDVSGVDTYTVSVKTDGKVEDSNTGIVTGGTVYDYLHGDTIALGKGSEATGTQSIAIGFGNKVSGNNSGAIGDPNTVEGDNSWAFGNNNQIPGSNSIVLGNKNNVSGSNTFVLGNNVTADVDNAVVLGDGSKAEADAVSVGSDGGERQIKHVKDGTDDTDAATVGQLKALAGGTGAGLEEVTHRIDNLDSKINKVGAGAAALAALHPLDTDNKFTMAAGFGNYRNANAMALGMFYRPTDKVMFSVGGAMGNGENMINAGVSFALDKGVGTSKAAMAKKIAAQDEKITSLEDKNAQQAAEIAALKEALARLEAKVGK